MHSNTHTLVQRLDALNQIKIDRALSIMTEQEQEIYHLLPVLLHFNHPKLPGYFQPEKCELNIQEAQAVPQGIFQFQLSSTQRRLITQFLPTANAYFDCTLELSEQTDILALYTMGSTSSLGQSASSDVDLWVCVSPDMNREKRDLLTQKCLLLTDCAQEYGLEVNFFLMDENRFRDNQSEEMTGDNCGSSQHLLLLDEFYRSAVRLAGQRLLWQIVPPDSEADYDQYVSTLCSKGGINCSEWIDFGSLNHIPAAEYFGSNLWQLYKSIDSPYKSVLKAILLESYSWEYPSPDLLSIQTKRHFFTYDEKPYCMDSYFLLLEKVTQYLERIGDFKRLDLVRRCFYLKTHEKLTQADSAAVAWRQVALRELTEPWGWSHNYIAVLDNRRNWKVAQVKKVHHELLDALMLSYRNLIQFARRNDITSAISPEDISILSRKLYAAFEVLPGKVTLLNTQISPDLHEPNLSFIQVLNGRSNAAGWYLYKQPLDAHAIIGQAPLEHNQYLSKLVAWAFFNGLITEKTKLESIVRDGDCNIDKLYQFVGDLRNTFLLDQPRPDAKALASPCEVTQLSIIINLDDDPTKYLSRENLGASIAENSTENVDVLSYSEHKECLIASVDLVYRNSWHEVRTMHFSGESSIISALKTILSKMHQDALPPESVDVFCYSENLSSTINDAVLELLNECIELRLKPVKNEKRRRFKVIKVADQMYGLFFERRGVSVMKLENAIDFYSSISTNKLQSGSALLVVGKNQELPPPDVVDAFASEGLIQFFFEDDEDGFNIYVFDENNAVEVYRQFNGAKDDIVRDVNRYYTQGQQGSGQSRYNFNLPQYYQVIHPDNGDSYVLPYRRKSCIKKVGSGGKPVNLNHVINNGGLTSSH